MAKCLSRRDQIVYSIFQNCAPRGTKVSYSNGFKMKESVYRDGFITNSNHQFFQDPKSNIWTTFLFSFFALTLWSWNLFLFRNISEIQNDKMFETQVHLFHAYANIKARFTFLKKHIHERKHSWSKDKQKLHLVDPLS